MSLLWKRQLIAPILPLSRYQEVKMTRAQGLEILRWNRQTCSATNPKCHHSQCECVISLEFTTLKSRSWSFHSSGAWETNPLIFYLLNKTVYKGAFFPLWRDISRLKYKFKPLGIKKGIFMMFLSIWLSDIHPPEPRSHLHHSITSCL